MTMESVREPVAGRAALRGSPVGVLALLCPFVWHVMAPTWMPPTGTLDPCTHDSSLVRDSISFLRLYWRARWSDIPWTLLRSHPASTGSRDTFELDQDPPGGTFAVAAVDSHGLEGCWTLRTVGIPPLGVQGGGAPRDAEPWYDVAGRRVYPPLAPGIYFTRGPHGAHRVVVLRRFTP